MKISKVYFATGIRNWITAIWILELRNLRTRSVTGICSTGTGAYVNAGAIGDASALIILMESFGACAAGDGANERGDFKAGAGAPPRCFARGSAKCEPAPGGIADYTGAGALSAFSRNRPIAAACT